MQPGISERGDYRLRKKKQKKTRWLSQGEVRDRSQPEKCDEHDLAAQPVIRSLQLTETTGSTRVPSSGGVGDRQCMTNILPEPAAATVCGLYRQTEKGLEKYVCLHWWFNYLTTSCRL